MHRLGGFGISGIRQAQEEKESFQRHGEQLASEQLAQVLHQADELRENLLRFAKKHGAAIQQNPEFASRFISLCQRMDIVVPLTNQSREELHNSFLVRLYSVLISLQSASGGLISWDVLVDRLGDATEIEKSLSELKIFGGEFKVLCIHGSRYVQTVHSQFSNDTKEAIAIAKENHGFVTIEILQRKTGWSAARCVGCANRLIAHEIVWIDGQSEPVSYWFPLFAEHF